MLDDYSAAVPAELGAVEAVLHAYRRWGRDDVAALTWRRVCNSAERLYRAPGLLGRDADDDDELELCDDAALRIDAAVRSLPGVERAVLVALYLKPDSVRELVRLGIQPAQAQRAHLDGLRRLSERLVDEVSDA